MSEPKLSEDLQGELGQRLAAGQHVAWREAIQRSEALEQQVERLERTNVLAKSFLSTEEWLKIGQTLAAQEKA